MKNKSIKKFYIFLSLFFLFLTITKIDYRTSEPHPWSSHDDASYYFHAYTLGIDFDLDFKKLWLSQKAKDEVNYIRRSKCFCTHECFNTVNIHFNPKFYPKVINKVLLMK